MNEIFSAVAPSTAALPDFPAWRTLSDQNLRDLLSGATLIDLVRNQASTPASASCSPACSQCGGACPTDA